MKYVENDLEVTRLIAFLSTESILSAVNQFLFHSIQHFPVLQSTLPSFFTFYELSTTGPKSMYGRKIARANVLAIFWHSHAFFPGKSSTTESETEHGRKSNLVFHRNQLEKILREKFVSFGKFCALFPLPALLH